MKLSARNQLKGLTRREPFLRLSAGAGEISPAAAQTGNAAAVFAGFCRKKAGASGKAPAPVWWRLADSNR